MNCLMIENVLSDGSIVNTVEGKVVKAEDHKNLYSLMVEIMKGGEKTEAVQAPD